MRREFACAVLLAVASLSGRAAGHDPHMDPMDCDAGPGETCYIAHLSSHHSPLSPHHDATGHAVLVLNSARTELRYSLQINGLDLDPVEANRVAPEDITGIHLHLDVPGTIGPHVLNIFGWPAEEDADAMFDFENESLTGIYDISDTSINPDTGLPFLQNLPLTTKIIYDWLDDLDDGELMIAVHTVATGFGVMAIHGLVEPVVPEPSTMTYLVLGACPWWYRLRRGREWVHRSIEVETYRA